MMYFSYDPVNIVNDSLKSHYIYPSSPKKAQLYLGIILGASYAAYFTGKVVFSIITEKKFKSGVPTISIAMGGSSLFLFLVSIIDISTDNDSAFWRISILCICLMGLSFVQSAAWIGLVKILANWITSHYYGRVMSVLSINFALADTFVRLCFAWMLDSGFSWRNVFITSSLILFVGAIMVIFLLKNKPENRHKLFANALKMQEKRQRIENKKQLTSSGNMKKSNKNNNISGTQIPMVDIDRSVNEDNGDKATFVADARADGDVDETEHKLLSNSHSSGDDNDDYGDYNDDDYDDDSDDKTETDDDQVALMPLIKNRKFQYILVIAFKTYSLRMVFWVYSSLFLVEYKNISESKAAMITSFPALSGVAAIILSGIWVDYMNKHNRHDLRLIIAPICCFVTSICYGVIALWIETMPLSLVAIIYVVLAFTIVGPYSLLAGVLALDLGGAYASGFVAGMVDAAGYVCVLIVMFLSSFLSLRFIYGINCVLSMLTVISWLKFIKLNNTTR